MQNKPDLSQTILENAERCASTYKSIVADIPYEEKGIFYSELFFVYALLHGTVPERIIESGRARGQSTYILSVCFPESRIISYEFDNKSPDVPIAEARLGKQSNVQLEYGDACERLPAVVTGNDVVIIDGPKNLKALRLALGLLQSCAPRMVFIHDCYRGHEIRDFIEAHCSSALFSDDSTFIERYRYLDDRCWQTSEDGAQTGWQPYMFSNVPCESYGPTFACLPYDESCDYSALLSRLKLFKAKCKLRKSILQFGK